MGAPLGFLKLQNRTKFGGQTEKPLKKSMEPEKPHLTFGRYDKKNWFLLKGK